MIRYTLFLCLIVLIPPMCVAQVQVTSEQWHEANDPPDGTFASIIPVGPEAPDGYGKWIEWDRAEAEANFVIFVNPADAMGVAIANLREGDVIEMTSASGVCEFDDGDESEVSSVVALIGAAAAAEFGPEAAPIVQQGEEFAQTVYGSLLSDHEPRDAFGQNPANGDYAEDEGGILICLPEAGGIYYQGPGSIKDQRPRTDDIRPDHVQHGFFPVMGNQDHNRRTVGRDGELYIVAWDSQFDDNQGYYRVFLKVTRGDR